MSYETISRTATTEAYDRRAMIDAFVAMRAQTEKSARPVRVRYR